MVFLFLVLISAAVVLMYGRRHGEVVTRLLLVALGARIVGAMARYELIFRFYDGLGDAVRFFDDGMQLARQLWALSITPFSLDYWTLETARWGTQFAIQISGLVLAVIGPNLRAEFIVFAMFGYLGILAIIFAFDKFHRTDETLRFAWLVVLWPSVWFWPSSVGKESMIVLAIGLVTLGYSGDGKYARWPLVAAGLGLAFMIRPHVAFVLAFAVVAAEWFAKGRAWTPRRLLEAVAGIVVAVIAFRGMQDRFGLMEADMEGFTEFIEWHMGQTLQGGSNIGAVTLSPFSVPLVLMNVWMRPFPWEAHNLTAMVSAAEMLVLWWLIWRHRAGLPALVSNWRRHRLVRFSVFLWASYTLMIGFTFGNLGLIARQRAPIFPFTLMIFVALPSLAAARQSDHRIAAARQQEERLLPATTLAGSDAATP